MLEWLVEVAVDILGYWFMSGDDNDRQWSILKICITLTVVILLGVVAYKFLFLA